MPNPKKKIWEDDGFKFGYLMKEFYAGIIETLPPGTQWTKVGGIVDLMLEDEQLCAQKGEDRDEVILERLDEFEGVQAFDRNGKNIRGDNALVKSGIALLNQEVIDKAKQRGADLREGLRKAMKADSDPLWRQYFEDTYKLCDPEFDVTRAIFSSPSAGSFASTMTVAMPNPARNKGLLKEERDAMGSDLVEAIYGVRHACAQEILTEYERQKLEKGGWTKEKEQQFLKTVYNTHKETMRAYEKLSHHKDDPEKQTAKYMGNDINQILGTGADAKRDITPYIGIIRGENQAIENGWGKDELAILGVIGEIDIHIERTSRWPTKAYDAGDIAALKGEFAKLKADCWTKVINDPAEKVEIVRKLQTFVEKNKDTEFGKECLSFATSNIKACVDKAIAAVKEDYLRTYGHPADEADGPAENVELYPDAAERRERAKLRENDPVQYLNGLLAEAAVTGDYKKAAMEFAERQGTIFGNPQKYPKETRNAMRDYLDNHVFTLPAQEREKFARAFRSAYMDVAVELQRETEKMAQAIRAGKVEIPGPIQPFHNDYQTSKAMAAQILGATQLHRQMQYMNSANYLMVDGVPNYYPGICDEVLKEKLKDNGLGLTGAEYRTYWSQDNEYTDTASSLGFQQKKDNTFEKLPDDERIQKGLQDHYKKTNKFKEMFDEIRAAARQQLDALRPLSTGNRSANFKRMLHALEGVVGLNETNTPEEIYEALDHLGAQATAYKAKINKQTFAGISSSGSARLRIAGELEKFGGEKLQDLMTAGAYCVAPHERLDAQMVRTQDNIDNFIEYAAQRDAAAQAQANQAQPVQQEAQPAPQEAQPAPQEAPQAEAQPQAEVPQAEAQPQAEVPQVEAPQNENRNEINLPENEIRNEAPQKAAPKEIDVAQALAEVQNELAAAKEANGGKAPENDSIREPLAKIIVLNSAVLQNLAKVPERDYKANLDYMLNKSKSFDNMIKTADNEKIFQEATDKNGMDLLTGSFRLERRMRRDPRLAASEMEGRRRARLRREEEAYRLEHKAEIEANEAHEMNAAFKNEAQQAQANAKAGEMLDDLFGGAAANFAQEQQNIQDNVDIEMKAFKNELRVDEVKEKTGAMLDDIFGKAQASELKEPAVVREAAEAGKVVMEFEVMKAQGELRGLKGNNSDKIPEKQDMREALARIYTANNFLSGGHRFIPAKVFEDAVKRACTESATMNNMLKFETKDTLYKEATTGMGKSLISGSGLRARARMKKDAEQAEIIREKNELKKQKKQEKQNGQNVENPHTNLEIK